MKLRPQLLPLLPTEEQDKLDVESDWFDIRTTPTQHVLCRIPRPVRRIALVDDAGMTQRVILLGQPIKATHRQRSKYVPHQGERERRRRIRQMETQRC